MTPVPAKLQDALSAYPWLRERGRDCILSPDCDGFLCGLYMSHFLQWRIRGFYDGKILSAEKNTDPAECVFLDMEICRPHVRSIGQHMLYFNVARPPHPALEERFGNCLSPNNIRRFDFKDNFMRKYPLGTIHLLMALSPQGGTTEDAADFAPLFYVDGTFKNLLNYPENCLDWLHFLDAENNALRNLFYGEYPFSRLMTVMRDFFRMLGDIAGPQRRADKLPLTTAAAVSPAQRKQTEQFVRTMGEMTGWRYHPENWTWDGYESRVLAKGGITPTLGRFQELMAQNPLSWAIISRQSIEYTTDDAGIFKL